MDIKNSEKLFNEVRGIYEEAYNYHECIKAGNKEQEVLLIFIDRIEKRINAIKEQNT